MRKLEDILADAGAANGDEDKLQALFLEGTLWFGALLQRIADALDRRG